MARHDPKELERQKFVRQRFRNLIRTVINNRMWLNDEDEQKKISMNVRRNVAMLVRPKHKIGVLTAAEKGIIRTPHVLRTVEERKILLKLIIHLTCFQTLSPQVCARLIPVIKFAFLEPGRVIMREGGRPNTVYFILYGEVEASRRVFDSFAGAYATKSEFIFSSGNSIGDIEMIEGCLRRHTYIATSAVELLVVHEEDFNEILRPAMSKEWYEKRTAIKALHYFDHFNEDQMISAQKLSVLREFDALETIYHEDLGEASSAFFVLSGECMILQSLQLKVTKKLLGKTYELLDLSEAKKRESPPKHAKVVPSAVKEEDEIDENISGSDENYDDEISHINMVLQTINANVHGEATRLSTQSELVVKDSDYVAELDDLEGHMDEGTGEFEENYLEDDFSISSEGRYDRTGSGRKSSGSVSKPRQSVKIKEEMLSLQKKKESIKTPTHSNSSRSSLQQKQKVSRNNLSKRNNVVTFERRFIDVGSLTFGGIFGLGEKIVDRVIMARTKVQCLLLPRYWLFEKEQNPGRIWQRRRFVVDTGIPSREQLYKDFLKTRKWQKYKNDFIASILDPNSIQNPTHYQDIPMMFHIINPVEE